MIPNLRAGLRYRPRSLIEFLRLVTILAYVDARLGLLPQRWNRTWLFRDTREAGRKPGPRTLERIAEITAMLRSASRFRVRKGSPCLALALALRSRLAALGIEPVLVYGTRKAAGPAGRIEAHAWLELEAMRFDPYGSAASFRPFANGIIFRPLGKN